MKIAIQANPSRGKEVIQILESLGGKNNYKLDGNNKDCEYYYHIDSRGIIVFSSKYDLHNCKFYTLEEFEEEFPFKVGDLCIHSSDILGEDIVVKILGMAIENDCVMYKVGHKDATKEHSYIYRKRDTLRPHKEMKEERNITLTLEKAKEWYKKGGELKEIALQAYSEEELTKVDLPKTWEEFCMSYPVQTEECWLSGRGTIEQPACSGSRKHKNWIPSRKSAEAHLAMIQLEQLRDCWRQGWKPEWNSSVKYAIKWDTDNLTVCMAKVIHSFLVFPTREMAEEFLKCFRDLIEQAGDLI